MIDKAPFSEEGKTRQHGLADERVRSGLKRVTSQRMRDLWGDRYAQWAPALLQRLTDAAFGFPIPNHVRQSRFIFIHVPKSAGTSISHAIYGKASPHRTALFYKDSDPEFFLSRVSLAVVRNPWDRLVSAYRFFRSGGATHSAVNKAKSPPQEVLRDFETFVTQHVLPNRRRLNELDDALHHQRRFICDRDARVIVKVIGRFERLHDFENQLRSLGAMTGSLEHLNRARFPHTRDYRSYYRQAIADAVGEAYEEDVKLFGYQLTP